MGCRSSAGSFPMKDLQEPFPRVHEQEVMNSLHASSQFGRKLLKKQSTQVTALKYESTQFVEGNAYEPAGGQRHEVSQLSLPHQGLRQPDDGGRRVTPQ